MFAPKHRKRVEQTVGVLLALVVITGTGVWMFAGSPTPQIVGETFEVDPVHNVETVKAPETADGRPQLVVNAEQALLAGEGTVQGATREGITAGWELHCRANVQIYECVGIHPDRQRIAYEIGRGPETLAKLQRRLKRDENR